MIISHKHKFVFVSVPKTASTTIRSCLSQYSDILYHGDKEKLIIHYPRGWKPRIKVFEHARLEHIKEFIELTDYFSFCFVRNPFEIALSNYLFFQKSIEEWDVDLEGKNRFKDVYNAYKETLKNSSTFREWIVNKKNCGWLDEYHWNPEQFHWARDVDFIGRFENLQEDFNTVCDKIGIRHQQLPHENKTKHKHYTEYYDDETKQIVAEKYAKDIEYFKYKFGDEI